METIAHFSHQHLLTICAIREHEEIDCAACEKHCSNQSYCCKKCKFFLHKSCAELSRELKHDLHPHNLTLCDTANLGCRHCDACLKRFRGFTYRCELCNFDLDIECARKSTDCSKVTKQIQHFSHGDSLILTEVIDEDKELWCRACKRRCLSNAYSCDSCQFFLHESCAELQQELCHQVHSHTLKLCPTVDDDAGLSCDFCGEIFHGFVYQCDECRFQLDVICAQQLPPSESGDQKEMDHFGHRHPLTPCTRKDQDEIFKCRACDKSCLGQVYGCERCEYFLHESCAKLPLEWEHLCPGQHPLKLQVAMYHYCDLCAKRIEGYMYSCEQCNFALDVLCAQMPPTRPGRRVTDTRQKVRDIRKRHFCHEHVLTGSVKREEDRVLCSGCKKRCSGLTYACDECKFYLHEGCYELPREYEHFFHPLHKLTLQNSQLGVYCTACEKKCRGFTFSCRECKFHMDVVCTMMAKKVTCDPASYIKHFSHGHPLKVINEEWNTKCSACNKQRLDLSVTYGCKKCRVWLHKSCAQLPQKIEHFFHKECPGQLSLEARPSLEPRLRKVKCRACHKECQGFIFRCERCRFKLDVECALMPSTIPEGTQTKYFPGHGHPLQLHQINEDATVRWCSVCKNRCVDATYECSLCESFVHESCTELTSIISHPFHLDHRLQLRIKDRFTCGACLKESSGFTYDCCSCPFSLHVGCANLKPKIQFDAHEHNLCFFDSLYVKAKCNACSTEIVPCSGKKNKEEMESKVEVIRCVRCNYNRHLLCGPLPCTIKSKNHNHDIQLEDKFLEDNSGIYYCDACERTRSPIECVYRCTQPRCPYVAHFDCMKSEVTCLLKGEQKDVELRTLRTRISGKLMSEDQEITKCKPHGEMCTKDVPTLENLLDAFLEEEQMKFPDAFQILTKEMCGLGLESFWEPLKGEGGIPKASPFSCQAFSQFRNMLEPETENSHFSMTFFENEVFVDVEGFMVVQSLAPVLKKLLEKRGDISMKSQLSSNSKNLIFTMLCGAIKNMSSTKVDHPFFETLFYNWWNHVKMAKHAGFETQFFSGHLDKILRARFAVQADKVQEEKLKELDGQIEKWQASSEEWTVKAAELTDARRRYRESAESSLIKVTSNEAKELEDNTVGSALL
ncbi:hypothetical protein BT93_L2601 [Corymbia citriodora subsp. variegata]|uniref:Phorbol-ester/DAG-type domain-containing protein n=1 Tax=Corymbia citriodora subsp. variegata TaxID=360336 RepID=A0A8T0CW36_CORYI|nr:hypothetical protein BT93_L2601 [Corymbia citriodora subsp. variegata]